MHKDLNKYNFIIFDCDGVIFDTNKMKSNAFGNAVRNYPQEIIDEFVKYHQKSGGVSRYIKFQKFITDFLGVEFFEPLYQQLLSSYSKECIEIYQKADLTPGYETLILKLKSIEKKLYVASGSDELELKEAFIKRGIYQDFEAVYGSPKKKLECVNQIIKEHINECGVIIGDSFADYKAAEEAGLDFIFMQRYSEMTEEQVELCKKKSDLVINDLNDLLVKEEIINYGSY
jgi:phosphoglycolate phosphatase-like HAD superfamily hydrolase